MLHRPGLELERLTPRNKDDLLFDDVLWVKRARQEHDAFADALARTRRPGAVPASDLLAETLADRGCARRSSSGTLQPPRLGPRLGAALREWLRRAAGGRACGAADRRDHARRAAVRRSGSLAHQVARLDDFVLPPLPNHLFTRDTSAWIYGGVCINRDGEAGPGARVRSPRRDLPPPSALRRRTSSMCWSDGADGAARSRAATCSSSATAASLVGMGERTTACRGGAAGAPAVRGRRGAIA